MSFGVARKGDICTGHSCFPSRPSLQGSPDSFADGRPQHRKGDAWAIHTCGKRSHPSILKNGSPTVFVNSRNLGRITDPIACGSRVRTGSQTVFSG